MSEAKWWISAWPTRDPERMDQPMVTIGVGDFIVPVQFEATVVRKDSGGTIPDEFAGEWPPIRMQIEMQDAHPVVRELTIGKPPEPLLIVTGEQRARMSPDELDELSFNRGEGQSHRPHRPITAALVRELPIARLAKHAMLGVAVRFGDGPAAEWVVPRDVRDSAGFYRIGPGEVDDESQYGVYFGGIEPAWQELWSERMEALAAHVDRASAQRRRNRITDDLLEHVAQIYRAALAERRPPKKAVRAALHVSEATAGRYIMRARERGHLGKTVRGKKGEISQ
jgi:hypothetical protein